MPVGMHFFVGGGNMHRGNIPIYFFFLLKLVDGVVEVLCFVGIQGYSQGADLTARGGRGGAVYTWVIASILPFQTPTVTHQ